MEDGRPRFVWPISAFFLAASVAISLAFVLALSDRVPLTPAQQDYIAGLTPLDFLVIGSVMTCNLLGALCLVRRRQFAVPLLVTGWTFGFFELVWQAAAKGWGEAIGAAGIGGFAAANLLSLVIIAYALGLARRGILH
jgi:hypothetical protein